MLLGLVAGLAIAAGAAFAPGKEAKAQTTWECFKSTMYGPCGCKDKCLNNCTCPDAAFYTE